MRWACEAHCHPPPTVQGEQAQTSHTRYQVIDTPHGHTWVHTHVSTCTQPHCPREYTHMRTPHSYVCSQPHSTQGHARTYLRTSHTQRRARGHRGDILTLRHSDGVGSLGPPRFRVSDLLGPQPAALLAEVSHSKLCKAAPAKGSSPEEARLPASSAPDSGRTHRFLQPELDTDTARVYRGWSPCACALRRRLHTMSCITHTY